MSYAILFLVLLGSLALIVFGIALQYWIIKTAVRDGVTEALQTLRNNTRATSPDIEDEEYYV